MSEKELWQEVLNVAIDDALNGCPTLLSSSKATRVNETKRARNYLTTPSEGLAMVCAMAGVDMRSVIDRMKTKLANAPTPEELIGGPKSARMKAATISFNGETLTIEEWSERTGISKTLIYSRLSKGWKVEDVLTKPNRRRRVAEAVMAA